MLAAFWIQFMTHDWFSHLEEGHNAPEYDDGRMHVAEGERRRDAAVAGRRRTLGCRPEDAIDAAFVARRDRSADVHSRRPGRTSTRAPKTFRNTITAWWDASQIYGYDETSRRSA